MTMATGIVIGQTGMVRKTNSYEYVNALIKLDFEERNHESWEVSKDGHQKC